MTLPHNQTLFSQNPMVSESVLCQHSNLIKMNEEGVCIFFVCLFCVFFFFFLWHSSNVCLHTALDLLTLSTLLYKTSQARWEGSKHLCSLQFTENMFQNFWALKFLIFQHRHLELPAVPCAAFCWVFGAFSLCSQPLLLIKGFAWMLFSSTLFLI